MTKGRKKKREKDNSNLARQPRKKWSIRGMCGLLTALFEKGEENTFWRGRQGGEGCYH